MTATKRLITKKEPKRTCSGFTGRVRGAGRGRGRGRGKGGVK
jgi:hypothetical protein